MSTFRSVADRPLITSTLATPNGGNWLECGHFLCDDLGMRAVPIALVSLAFACAQARPVPAQDLGQQATGQPLIAAEAFIGDFYSFDPVQLRKAMANATGSMGDIVYYQGWAKAGNYVVLERKPCRFAKADEVICGVTVKDDLAPALHISFHVTDTFHFAF